MKRKIVNVLAIVTTVVYIVWRIGWSLPYQGRIIDMIFAVILFVAELIGFWEATGYLKGSMAKCDLEKPEIPFEEYPDVDVFIATYNEETDLLRKTVNGCLNMDYPEKSKVHIYICDDNDRPEMAELAEHMGVGYFRRDTHKGAKAGNLNHALENTTSPLVATFDADMIPMHDFLMTVVPYFFQDRYEKKEDGSWGKRKVPGKKVGFAQTPQSFYNADLFQYNLFSEKSVPNEQNFFFQTVQCGRNQSNAVIYAGSNTILSREALESVGGFYEKAITEDLATGLCIQSNGYASYALSEVHANGLAPTDIKSLFKQRDRWARGCIQTFRQLHLFRRKGMTGQQRKAYISSLLYWYTPIRRAIFLLSPILFAVFGIQMLNCSLQEILGFWLPHYVFYTWALALISGKQRTARLSNIYDTILAFQLIPGVLLETFGIKKEKFEVTKKNTQTEEETVKQRIYYALPHIILIVLSLVGIFEALKESIMGETAGYLIILFWLIANLYTLCMSVFFIMGRKYYRETERFRVSVPVTIQGENYKRQVLTHDISEGGLAFELAIPEYVPDNQKLFFTITDSEGRYQANLTGRIVHVQKYKKNWRYSVVYNEIEEKELLQLYQIVYDRVPTLPAEVNQHSSFYEDLKNNISKRKRESKESNRKLPRVDVYRKLYTPEGERMRMLNFNYSYVLIRNKKRKYQENLILKDQETEITFVCKLKKVLYEKNNQKAMIGLYTLENEAEFQNNREFERILAIWEKEAEEWSERQKKIQKELQKTSPYEFKEEAYL
ncbi:MAG: glycosyltransferase [Roseburia sp.]